jgi:phosphatidylglycerol lysyltransferase
MAETVTPSQHHFDGDNSSTGVREFNRTNGHPHPDSDPQFDALLEPRTGTTRTGLDPIDERVEPALKQGPLRLTESPRPPQTSNRWLRTERQAFAYGTVYDSYFATENGWKRFWSRDRSGLISYRRLGRYVKVIGGLLARPEDKPRLLQEFVAFARSHRMLVTFFNVTEEDAQLFRERGFQVTKWGEEPFVDLPTCTWTGKQFEWVRRQTNYCRRAGLSIVEHCREEMDDLAWTKLIEELRAISDEHLSTKSHAGTIKLLEGQLDEHGWGRRRLFVAYSSDSPKRIEGFLVALPSRNGTHWAFEMYRHRRDSVRGVVAHLFHVAMMRMKEEGIEAVSLCLAPAVGCDQPLEGDSAMTRHALRMGLKYLNFLFDFAGIYHFKSRFRPRYENRYICALPGTTLLTGLALVRMSGMLAFSVRRVGASLLQKHLKRRQRAHLAVHTPLPLIGPLPADRSRAAADGVRNGRGRRASSSVPAFLPSVDNVELAARRAQPM